MGENKTPEYTRKAIDKYLSKLESKTIRFPKGTTERIKAQGKSVNGFVNDLVIAELDRLEQGETQEPEPEQQETDYNKFIF